MNLDSIEEIKKLDKENLISSIYNLADQVSQAWDEVGSLPIADKFSGIENIVVAGMGGSALGARVIDSLLFERLNVPLEIVTDYSLPEYVSEKTLVICSSYSGNTDETVSAFFEAKNMHAQIFVITTGGKLHELAEEHLISYTINPYNNPSDQPRMALGYSIVSILAILSKLGLAHFSNEEIKNLVEAVKSHTGAYMQTIPEKDNYAKKLALSLKGKSPVLIAGQHLVGVGHAFKNILNENAKTFATLFDLPELNHHLLEGLKNPAELRSSLVFIFFESNLYSNKLNKVLPITKEIVEKQDIETLSIALSEKSLLHEVFEVLVLGLFTSYYLALLYNIDPTPIPWVKYLKDHSSN